MVLLGVLISQLLRRTTIKELCCSETRLVLKARPKHLEHDCEEG